MPESRISAAQLRRFATTAFERLGPPAEDAAGGINLHPDIRVA